jgi:hypothetical protein
MGILAEYLQRFFHPAAIEAMLETFVPLINGTDVDVRPSPFDLCFNLNENWAEHIILSVLFIMLLAHEPPTILSPYAVQDVGVY